MVFNNSVRPGKSDCWGKYPVEYARLLSLIKKSAPKTAVLVGGDVHHDGVTLLDERIRVTNGATVVQTDARHALVPELFALHLAQLVLRLDGFDAVHDEATLVVVNQTEVFIALLDGHDVCRYRKE